jgi:hypothetical protein
MSTGRDMEESIRFKFYGALSDEHRMDFYESARFQYAAARLAYKLDSFRRTGTFPQKISNKIDTRIELIPYKSGCFDITFLAPLIPIISEYGKPFIEVPISSLLSYAFDRLFRKDETASSVSLAEKSIDGMREAVAALKDNNTEWMDFYHQQDQERQELWRNSQELYERLLAEKDRQILTMENQNALKRIGVDQEREIMRMAAPLIRELEVPLRKSADYVRVYRGVNDNYYRMLHVDYNDLQAISLEEIDKNSTTATINVIQYNKKTGWGKCEWGNTSKPISFSIPRDRLDYFNDSFAEGLKSNVMIVEIFVARDYTGEPKPLIVANIIDIMPE